MRIDTGDDVPAVNVDRLRLMLERAAPVMVLDIRPPEERAEWSIPGSVHRDAYRALREGDGSALDDVRPAPGTPVIAVCAGGETSRIAARVLRQRGLDAYSLSGGMKAWSLAWNTAELAGGGAPLVQVRRTGKGCLSYVAASGTEAVVIDASLDPGVYLDVADARGWTIRHVLDTHIHADHLSRSRALAERAGAPLWLPRQRRARYPHHVLDDGGELRFGTSTLVALSTPGHTMESVCYRVDGRWLFAGDTLFLSGVGRPDLVASAEETRTRAALLHASLAKLLALDPDLLVLPSHTNGPVPFDGVPIAATLRAVREAVRLPESASAFTEYLLERIPPAPANHHTIVGLNEAGELPAGDPTDLEAGANRCAVS
jgi:glyoxylase-like metal-dependent hydrolase (beta-lactamase superfamily II)